MTITLEFLLVIVINVLSAGGFYRRACDNAVGDKFSIHAHCNQSYKRQYIIDNYIDTTSVNKRAKECKTTTRFVYKVIKEYVEGNKG